MVRVGIMREGIGLRGLRGGRRGILWWGWNLPVAGNGTGRGGAKQENATRTFSSCNSQPMPYKTSLCCEIIKRDKKPNSNLRCRKVFNFAGFMWKMNVSRV